MSNYQEKNYNRKIINLSSLRKVENTSNEFLSPINTDLHDLLLKYEHVQIPKVKMNNHGQNLV